MSAPPSDTDLVRWDVPFASTHDPSVSLVTEEGGGVASLIVAPRGIDRYPKYSVRVTGVVALLCYEEAFAFDRGYSLLSREADLCAYRWIDSPWLLAYRSGEELMAWGSLQHYVVFGGDSIVEVVASGVPVVEEIEHGKSFEVRHEA